MMKITRGQLRRIIAKEVADRSAALPFSLAVVRAVEDQTVKRLFSQMMSRIMELVDVNGVVSDKTYDQVSDPHSAFAHGIYDAIVDDLSELLQGDAY